MKRSALIFLVCCLFVQWTMAQAPKWLDKTKKAIFSVITYDKDNNILNTGNGFFVTSNGVALSDYTLFRGAQRADVVTSDGKTLPVSAIMGANSMYDVVKFRVAVDKKGVTPLTVATNVPGVGEEVFLIPYATQKERLLTSGTVKEVAKAGDTHQYYTLNLKLNDKQISCPVMNNAGEVLGVSQKAVGIDAETICYAVGTSFAMNLEIGPLSFNDVNLKGIGIKTALPESEEKALVYLFMASSNTTPEEYAQLLDDFIVTFPQSADGYMRRAANFVYTSPDAAGVEKAIADMNRAFAVSTNKDDVHYSLSRMIYGYALTDIENKYAEWTLEKSLEEVRKAIKMNPLPIYTQMEGDILFAMKDYEGAYVAYDAVSRTNLVSPKVFYSAARAKIMMGVDKNEVIALLDSCVAHAQQPIRGEDAAYLLERAGLYMEVEKYRLAMLDYDAYYESVYGQVNDVFYYFREQAAINGKQYQRALDDINKAIEIAPEKIDYHTELGAINLRVGRYEEAIKSFNNAIALDAEYAEPYRLIGITYMQMKNNEEACKFLNKAKELGSEGVDELIRKSCQ